MNNHQSESLAEKIKDLTGNPIDLEVRAVKTNRGALVQLAFLRSLADPAQVTHFFTQNDRTDLTKDSFAQTGEVFMAEKDDTQNSFLITNLLKGATIVYLPDQAPFAVLTNSMAKRLPSEPVNEPAVRGSRYGFI